MGHQTKRYLRKMKMFEDTTATVVLSVMIVIMIFALIGILKLNQDTRKIDERNKAREAKKRNAKHTV